MNTQRYQKHKEVAVITPSNAVVHPWTVMVKRLDKKKIKKLNANHNDKPLTSSEIVAM